jgi:hypothetical protein
MGNFMRYRIVEIILEIVRIGKKWVGKRNQLIPMLSNSGRPSHSVGNLEGNSPKLVR